MIDLLDNAINMLLRLGNVINTITLDVRSYEQLHMELGQKGSKLIGYKGYAIEVSYENSFSNFKIEIK